MRIFEQNERLAEHVNTLIGLRNYSIEEFAGRLGVAVPYATRLLSGEAIWPLALRTRLQDVFQTSFGEYFDPPTGSDSNSNLMLEQSSIRARETLRSPAEALLHCLMSAENCELVYDSVRVLAIKVQLVPNNGRVELNLADGRTISVLKSDAVLEIERTFDES